LLSIEASLLQAGLQLRLQGTPEFHGFMIAKEIKHQKEAKRYVTQGTLYRALNRMENAGLLTSRWEDPEISEREGRPRRRLYQVTASGEQALAKAKQTTPDRPQGLETRKAEN
jgi:DNA-binding PadR family transcriptional regulator|tara:strand:+ start:2300 stop:2638 length:339 start_codon:yes stop_codon:yes gene_type:complete